MNRAPASSEPEVKQAHVFECQSFINAFNTEPRQFDTNRLVQMIRELAAAFAAAIVDEADATGDGQRCQREPACKRQSHILSATRLPE
jgi:hypothetical protein